MRIGISLAVIALCAVGAIVGLRHPAKPANPVQVSLAETHTRTQAVSEPQEQQDDRKARWAANRARREALAAESRARTDRAREARARGLHAAIDRHTAEDAKQAGVLLREILDAEAARMVAADEAVQAEMQAEMQATWRAAETAQINERIRIATEKHNAMMEKAYALEAAQAKAEEAWRASRQGSRQPVGTRVRLGFKGEHSPVLAASERAFSERAEAARIGDRHGLANLVRRKQVFTVDGGTLALVLDASLLLGASKVRILSGPWEGHAGWVADSEIH